MQSNDYGDYDDYVLGYGNEAGVEEDLLNSSETGLNLDPVSIDFDDPLIASMPKILLMGPRRGGGRQASRYVVATIASSWTCP